MPTLKTIPASSAFLWANSLSLKLSSVAAVHEASLLMEIKLLNPLFEGDVKNEFWELSCDILS